jgi:hypothetical protein
LARPTIATMPTAANHLGIFRPIIFMLPAKVPLSP